MKIRCSEARWLFRICGLSRDKCTISSSVSPRCRPLQSVRLLMTTTNSSGVKSKINQVESNWLNLLIKMADQCQSSDIKIPGASTERVQQIREMLSKAVRAKRTLEAGDLMPNVIAKEIRHFYTGLASQAEKLAFFLVLERDLGVNHQDVLEAATSLTKVQGSDVPVVLRAEERMRQALEPPYIQLLSQISKLRSGVKDIVDMRRDLLEGLSTHGETVARQELQSLSSSIKSLLAQWFATGLLDLERCTWESPCSILEKIIRYEAVHPIRDWDDLKRRLSPDRRCYIYTHRSMPGEPIVVLHTALENNISDNIQVVLSEPEVDANEYEYELDKRTTAVFYSISSTQKGLSGVDLGNFLIKHVVEELRHEFPNISQFSTLSPIPGFRQWLQFSLNDSIEKGDESTFLLQDEREKLLDYHGDQMTSPAIIFKELTERLDWPQDSSAVDCLKKPLMRLCARYLYNEKRRGFAMDPVANFHIRNGACMWRLNWLADTSPRGLQNSCSMMMNYKYELDDVDRNNQNYLLNGNIASSPQFMELLNPR